MKTSVTLITATLLLLAVPPASARGRHRYGPEPGAGVYASMRQPGFSISIAIPWSDPPRPRYRRPRREWVPGRWVSEPVWVPGYYEKVRKQRHGRHDRWEHGGRRTSRGGYRMKEVRR